MTTKANQKFDTETERAREKARIEKELFIGVVLMILAIILQSLVTSQDTSLVEEFRSNFFTTLVFVTGTGLAFVLSNVLFVRGFISFAKLIKKSN